MNLPNAITLSRLFLTVVFVVGTRAGHLPGHIVALVAFTIAAASDWLDGYLARKLGLVTPLGKLLDPLADKILVCTAFVFFSVKFSDPRLFPDPEEPWNPCPVWVTSLIIAREFLVTGLRQIAVEAGQVLAADNLGKWKTTFQLIFCITGLVWLTFHDVESTDSITTFLVALSRPKGWLMQLSLYAALALTVISGANYVWNCRHLLRSPKP